MMVVDLDDAVMMWNAAAAALYETPLEGAVGRSFRDLDVSYRIEGLRARVEEVKTKHIPARLEELQSTNEELETTVEELQAANAELATLNAELERRTEELKRLDEYQSRVLDSFDVAVVVFDRNATVKTWNAGAERLWGLRAEQVVGRPFWTLPIGDVTHVIRTPLLDVLPARPATDRGRRPARRVVGGRPRDAPLHDGDAIVTGALATTTTES